jgi:hypothetical protein
MEATVGRIVHYLERNFYLEVNRPEHRPEPWAAIVTRVHAADVVDLVAFPPPTGGPVPALLVRKADEAALQRGEPQPAGTWRWPPRAS